MTDDKPTKGPLKIPLAFDDAMKRLVTVKPQAEDKKPAKKKPKAKR